MTLDWKKFSRKELEKHFNPRIAVPNFEAAEKVFFNEKKGFLRICWRVFHQFSTIFSKRPIIVTYCPYIPS